MESWKKKEVPDKVGDGVKGPGESLIISMEKDSVFKKSTPIF